MKRIRRVGFVALVALVAAGLWAAPSGASPRPAAAPVVAVTQHVSTPFETPLPIVLAGTGGDGHYTISVVTQPTRGTLSGVAPNLTYTPVPGFVGSDQFTFHVVDGANTSSPGTVFIDVTGVKPGAPQLGQVVPGDSEATVYWTAPVSTGSSAITSYVITVYRGLTVQALVFSGAGTTSHTVSGLSDGTGYWFTVSATNATGTGPASSLSPTVAPGICAPFPFCPTAVSYVYDALLGRPPSDGELFAAVDALDDGSTSLPALIASLRTNPDQTSNVDPVVRLYRAYFGRIPDAGGLTFWIARRRDGQSIPSISQNFASSTEFASQYGSLDNAQFVALVYENVLGRQGEPTGEAYWTSQLDSGKQNRGKVMVGFSESRENIRTQHSEVNTSVIWILLLGRAPTETEYENAVSQLQATVPLATIILGIMRTTEFLDHI